MRGDDEPGGAPFKHSSATQLAFTTIHYPSVRNESVDLKEM